MHEAAVKFTEYSYSFTQRARELRDQLPKELLPQLFNIIDDLARSPDAYPLRIQSLGQGQKGELVLYKHPTVPLEMMYEIDRNAGKISFIHFAAPIVTIKRVFVSYSHEDEPWLVRLRKYLKPLEDQGLIQVWDDSKIQVGTLWQSEIEKALAAAKMAVFLVTQDFLTSTFIQSQEMPQLLKNAEQSGVKIVWIAVKASTVEASPLFQYEAANNPKEPLESLAEPQQNKVLVEIYQKIKTAVA